jgi:hypothetical protein
LPWIESMRALSQFFFSPLFLLSLSLSFASLSPSSPPSPAHVTLGSLTSKEWTKKQNYNNSESVYVWLGHLFISFSSFLKCLLSAFIFNAFALRSFNFKYKSNLTKWFFSSVFLLLLLFSAEQLKLKMWDVKKVVRCQRRRNIRNKEHRMVTQKVSFFSL